MWTGMALGLGETARGPKGSSTLAAHPIGRVRCSPRRKLQLGAHKMISTQVSRRYLVGFNFEP